MLPPPTLESTQRHRIAPGMQFDALPFSADSTMNIGSRKSSHQFRSDFLRSNTHREVDGLTEKSGLTRTSYGHKISADDETDVYMPSWFPADR